MTRFRRNRRSKILQRIGVAVLVLVGTLVALFPSDVKQGLEGLFERAGRADQASAEPHRRQPATVPRPSEPPSRPASRQPETAPGPRPEPKPAPKPAPKPDPEPAPQPAGPPRATVVALGDAEVAPRLGSLLREALADRGVEGVEGQQNSIRLDELIREADFDPRASRVRDVAREEGCTVLVLIRGQPIGQREVSFYGRKDVATKWRVRVSVHDLRKGRALGPGWGGELETTERGAVASLEHFLEPIEGEVAPLVAGSLDDAREKLAAAGR